MTNQHKTRIIAIFFIFMVFYGLIICKLYFVQIYNTDFFVNRGKQQYTLTITSSPPRAWIYDRTGHPLALNRDSLSAFITPRNLHEPAKLKRFLRTHFPSALERLEKNPQTRFLYIKRRLSDAQLAVIEREAQQLPDLYILKEPSRFYPIESFGPLIGVTDIDNRGIFGIEMLYNNQLAGKPTTQFLEKDARSGHFYFKKETKKQGAPGTPVHLTIDADLQFLAYEELKETIAQFNSKEGSVLIMDPSNGDIIVMANYPDFDTNNTEHIDQKTTKNKIITEVYEFGSVMKTFLAMAALEEQLFTPESVIDCENKKVGYVNGMKLSTWKAHGLLTLSEVVEHSNNFGTAKVAQKIGTPLYDHYKRVGFGKKTSIKFPGEQAGFVNPPEKWSLQSLNSLSFGYEISATLLQLGCAFSVIANGGHLVAPRLTRTEIDTSVPLGSKQPLYCEKTLREMREILTKTITQGTARKAQIKGYTIFGKTGTANLIVNGKYSREHTIFTFVGVIEKGNYKRVIVTFIKEANDNSLHASSITVPLFERIAHQMLIHDKQI
jgi:Cell division protein FtsI/penicillin-binding protein 2